MIYLKPITELGLVIDALERYPLGRDHTAYATILDVWEQFTQPVIHRNLTAADVSGFVPMLHEVEEHVGVPLTHEELWFVHGVMDWYSFDVRPGCWITREVFNNITAGVGELDRPPY